MAEPENKGDSTAVAAAQAPAKPAAAAASATDVALAQSKDAAKKGAEAEKAALAEKKKLHEISINNAKAKLAHAKAADLANPTAQTKAAVAEAQGQLESAEQAMKAETGSSGNFLGDFDIGKLIASGGIAALVFFLVQSVTGGGTIGLILSMMAAVGVGMSGMGSGFGDTINGWLGRDKKSPAAAPGQQQALAPAQVPGTEILRVAGDDIARAAQQYKPGPNDKVRFVRHEDGKAGVEIVAANAPDANSLSSFANIAQALDACKKTDTSNSCGAIVTVDPKNPQASPQAYFVPLALQAGRNAASGR